MKFLDTLSVAIISLFLILVVVPLLMIGALGEYLWQTIAEEEA